MDDLSFIKEMMDFRYKSDPCPAYNDYRVSKDKIIYLGLAKIIKRNIEKGLY